MGWMVSLREKYSLYNVRIDILDTELSFPRERDGWIMQGFMALGYTRTQLINLNSVRLHQQVVFLSCILNAYGSALDEKYLTRRPVNQQWSTLKFPTERPTVSDLSYGEKLFISWCQQRAWR